MPTLCLGEALVDLLCERPVGGLGEAEAFVPHFGGAAANVAVTAARHGAAVALAGGVGADPWGEWLAARLRREGVDLSWFELIPGTATVVAFVTVSPAGEPSYQVYGDGIAAAMRAFEPHLEPALAGSEALFFGSNTLVGRDEREITMSTRRRALELGRPVVFDPNFRLTRWSEPGDAVSAARACLPDALLVRCNLDEAELLTGEREPERAARALARTGARLALVTFGAGGAVLDGDLRARVPGVPADVVSTVGAGDALMGVVLARLALGDFSPAAVADALPDAVRVAARVTERWGAVA